MYFAAPSIRLQLENWWSRRLESTLDALNCAMTMQEPHASKVMVTSACDAKARQRE
jgi:hypothetical protein